MNSLETLRRVRLKRDYVEVPIEDDEGNVTTERVYVRGITAAERHRILEWNIANPKGTFSDARVVAMALVYEDGRNVFADPDNDPDAVALNTKPEGLIHSLARKALLLSGLPLNVDSVEAVEKKS
jgi:hypothetical protein